MRSVTIGIMIIIKIAVLLSLAFANFIVSAEVISVPYQNNDPTRTSLIAVENPKALVILLMGGDGKAGFDTCGGFAHAFGLLLHHVMLFTHRGSQVLYRYRRWRS